MNDLKKLFISLFLQNYQETCLRYKIALAMPNYNYQSLSIYEGLKPVKATVSEGERLTEAHPTAHAKYGQHKHKRRCSKTEH